MTPLGTSVTSRLRNVREVVTGIVNCWTQFVRAVLFTRLSAPPKFALVLKTKAFARRYSEPR